MLGQRANVDETSLNVAGGWGELSEVVDKRK